MKVKTKTQWHAVLLIIGQIRGKRNSYESRFQFQMINVWQYFEWHCFHFLFFTEADDTWWYVMIRQIWDHTMKGASVDSQKWRAVMELLSLPRRSMTSPFTGERFHLSVCHNESLVLSHQSSKMGVSFIGTCWYQYCCYCRCGNLELFRMTLCPPILLAHLNWNHEWAFSELLLFVVCPSVCKCFWLNLRNHLRLSQNIFNLGKETKVCSIKGPQSFSKGRKIRNSS